jgi:hypothetical protein
MPPKKLGNEFKTIKITCVDGHEVARYRKPKSEWGHRTHKLWLLQERLARLSTTPPILVEDQKSREDKLDIPPTDTSIECGEEGCSLEVGKIAMVLGTVAMVLNERNLKPTRG